MNRSLNISPDVPLELTHSWPLFERARQFELGTVLEVATLELGVGANVANICLGRVGAWECRLADDSLTWSPHVYDIFGLPHGATVTREEAVALYCEESRAAMERLRAHAIAHRRGFTIDVEVRPATGAARWMRLIAAPLCEGDRPVRLHGLKLAL